MKNLITGGAGFIGSHLADALLARGEKVAIIDDLSTGSINNIAHLRDHPSFSYEIGTMLNPSLLAEMVDGADRVFHLAAAVGVKLIVESPVRCIETNIKCTEQLLEIAAKKRKKVFVASTSEVYGKSTDFPYREEADLVMGATSCGRWSYACSKAVDEFLAIAYWREKRLPTVVARLFNTVGPRQTGQYGMVVPRFVSQAVKGDPLTVYGDGSQSRCFTHVGDTVRAIIALMDCDTTVGEVYNIGSRNEITIRDLATRVRDRAGTNSPIIHVPYAIAYDENFEDMTRRVPALEKIGRAVGWTPSVDLDGILDSVFAEQQTRQLLLA
jgi:UDP-glucose 4-epimerase